MPQSLCKVYIHLVFSTKYQMDMIDTEIEKELYHYMSGTFREFDSPCLKINGAHNHVHCLFLLSRKIPICKVVEQVKARSSNWIKTMGCQYINFFWQNGYGAFSVSPTHLTQVKAYIVNQKSHHAYVTFKNEYIKFLEKYEIKYDKRYMWE